MLCTGRLKPDQKRAQNGFKPNENLERARKAPRFTLTPLEPSTLARHHSILRQLDEYLATRTPPGISINGVRVTGWQEWIDKGLPFPSKRVLEKVMQGYIDACKGQKGPKIQATTLEAFWTGLQAAWNRQAPATPIPRETIELGNDLVIDLVAKNSLPLDPSRDVSMDMDSVHALHKQTLNPAVLKISFEQRHDTMTFMTNAAHTALRPSSVIAPSLKGGLAQLMREENVHRRGVYFGSYRIFFFKPKPGEAANRAASFLSPRWSKTAPSRGKLWPLPASVPTVSDSTTLMLLISMMIKGGITGEQLDYLLDPARFEGKDYDIEEFVMPDEMKSTLVFLNKHKRPLTTSVMSGRLKRLSNSLGFKKEVTCYAFGHLGIRALRKHGERRSDIQDGAGHQIGSRCTGSYYGRRSLHDITQEMAIRRGAQTTRALLDVADKAAVQPRPDAPIALSDEQKAHAEAESATVQGRLTALKDLQARKVKIGEEEVHADQVRKAKNVVRNARKGACAQALRLLIEEYNRASLHHGPSKAANDSSGFIEPAKTAGHVNPVTVTEQEASNDSFERLCELYFLPPSEVRTLVAELASFLDSQKSRTKVSKGSQIESSGVEEADEQGLEDAAGDEEEEEDEAHGHMEEAEGRLDSGSDSTRTCEDDDLCMIVSGVKWDVLDVDENLEGVCDVDENPQTLFQIQT
ncbi:hypothetical protein I317_03014 [Kwoniella heveanensis CBS 569]|nr:hypothetical protein I317_03014 [Kwoniella heveanensis CBS 569]